jgi:hypothetical protein
MPDHISHSSLTKADACLRWWYETYLATDKIPSVANEYRDRGIGVHGLIEAFLKGEEPKWEGPTTELYEAMNIFERWKSRFSIPEAQRFASERYGELRIEGVPVLQGYDDLIYLDYDDQGEIVVIRDFKTGWSSEVKPEYAFQGELACLRFMQEYHAYLRVCYEIDFVRSGNVSERVFMNEHRARQVIERVKAIHSQAVAAKLRLAAGASVEEAFPATPHGACGFCPAKNECAVRKRTELAGLVVTEKESAENALHTIALLQDSIASLKEALRPYVDANGPIQLGAHGYDYVARYTQSVSSSRDPHAVAEIIPTSKWGKALKFDDKVKDGQRIAALPEVLAITKAGKTTTRWYVGPNKKEEE